MLSHPHTEVRINVEQNKLVPGTGLEPVRYYIRVRFFEWHFLVCHRKKSDVSTNFTTQACLHYTVICLICQGD